MKLSRLVALLTLLAFLVVFGEGAYVLRWITVLIFGIALSIILFGWELGLPPIELGTSQSRNMKRDEVKTLTSLIGKAKSGKTARKIIADMIVDIYATVSDDYGATYQKLRSEPNKPMRLVMGDGNFLDNLERAIELVEADINED
ncbi:hypothetical protein [Thermococcus sp.]